MSCMPRMSGHDVETSLVLTLIVFSAARIATASVAGAVVVLNSHDLLICSTFSSKFKFEITCQCHNKCTRLGF